MKTFTILFVCALLFTAVGQQFGNSAAFRGAAALQGTPASTLAPAWYDTGTFAEADSWTGALTPTLIYWTDPASLTLPAGNVSQLRVYVGTEAPGGDSLIIGLFHTNGVLVASNTVAIPSANGYATVSVGSVAITNGGYSIACDILANTHGVILPYKNAAGSAYYNSGSYPPLPGTLPSGTHLSIKFVTGAYVGP